MGDDAEEGQTLTDHRRHTVAVWNPAVANVERRHCRSFALVGPISAAEMILPPRVPANGLEAVFTEMRSTLVRRAAAMGAGSDAEDVVQDVWLKIHAAEGPVARPHAYLLRMVYTAVLDRRRGARRAAARDAAWSNPASLADNDADTADAERRLIAIQSLREVETRLTALGDPATAIFRRHRIDGLTQRRIAEEFGMGLSTVEKHLRRAYAVLLDLEEDEA